MATSISATACDATTISPLEVSGSNSKILEMELTPGRYLLRWSVEGAGHYFGVRDESEHGGKGTSLASAVASRKRSGEEIVRLAEAGPHLLNVKGDQLTWKFSFRPI